MPDKSIEVYNKTEKYLLAHPDLKQRISNLGWVYNSIGDIIPQTTDNYWSGHHFPFIESWQEFQISFNLICFGLYKQAFVSLRSGMELGLLSVYYNINDEGHSTVQNWLNSKDTPDSNSPPASKIWKILLSNNNINKFNNKHNLRKIFDDLGYLHNYIHTKGLKFSNTLGIFKSNSQTFEPEIIRDWLDSYESIISLVTTLHLLKYPIAVMQFDYRSKFGIDMPNFGGLDRNKILEIANLLPKDHFLDIEVIASEDLDTQHTIKQIQALPDITLEQMEEQVLTLEKLFIKGIGFKRWLEKEQKIYATLKMEFSETMISRVSILEEWAKENNLLESGEEP